MKIAMIQQPIGRISPNDLRDSIGIWIYETTHHLAKFLDVVVYAKKGRNQKKVESYGGVQYRRVLDTPDKSFVRILKFIDKQFCAREKRPLYASPLYCLTYAFQLAKKLRADNCNIVHIHNFSQLVPVIRAFNPDIKIVLHMHCEWLTQLDREMIEQRLREVDLIIGCSNYLTEKIRSRFPQFADRCYTVYNGVNVNKFVSANNKRDNKKKDIKRLIFVGRVSPEKGLHILLDSFKKIVEQYPKLQLEIIGPTNPCPLEWIVAVSDDPKVSALRSFYHRNYLSYIMNQLSDIANNVFFTGFIPYKHMINHYQHADVFINSSFSEAFGLPILEAMACELPVVASRVGGIPEAVENGESGLLVEPGDSTELARAILRLLCDENLRRSLTEAARERAVKIFSWEQTAKNLICQYEKIWDDKE